jgi:hypothetical protein
MFAQIRRRTRTVRIPVHSAGEAIFDKLPLPVNARAITGIHVAAQPKGIPFGPILPVFLYGTMMQPPTSGENLQVGTLATQSVIGKRAEFEVSPGDDQYIWYAYPVSLPDPSFRFGQFTGGFIEAGSFWATVTHDGRTQTQAYTLWRSLNEGLGNNLALTVTHV